MDSAQVLIETLDRIKPVVHKAVESLTEQQLSARLDADANPIGWLVWHLSRVQDDHLADVAGVAQCYVTEDWWERLGRPHKPDDIGYGHSSEQVAEVGGSADTLLGYYDAVHAKTVEYLGGLSDDDLDRVVDRSWDPPVTLGVRLVSVVSDCLQHAGQAAYVRGLLERASASR